MNGSGKASAGADEKPEKGDEEKPDNAKRKEKASSSSDTASSSWWWPCTSASPVEETEFILFNNDDSEESEWFIMEFDNVGGRLIANQDDGEPIEGGTREIDEFDIAPPKDES